ncbi:MAG TPA: hypothetical protein VF198_09880 [Vicinamibacterales bacterium]
MARFRFERVGVLALAVALSAAGAAAQTPSPDELVAKNVEAHGGKEKLASVQSLRITGTLSSQGQQMTLTTTLKRPNKIRQEMNVPGAKLVHAYDGEKAWALNPMMGPQPQVIEGLQADTLKNQSMIDGLLVGYKERGDKLDVVGPATVEGRKAWELKLTRGDGQVLRVFLDAETYLEAQFAASVNQDGMNLDVATLMGDYQPADGLMLARKVRTRVNGQEVATLNISNIEVNVPVEDSEFQMPTN